MEDRLIAVLLWSISVLISISSITQTKGIDWYAPITKKHKMIMTLINASVLFMIIVFMYEALFADLKKTALISFAILSIILSVIRPSIISKIQCYFDKYHERQTLRRKDDAVMDDKGPDDNAPDTKNTLKAFIQKYLTVFNLTYFLLNIFYIVYILRTEESITAYSSVVEGKETQVVSVTVLFWMSLVGVIITLMDWNYTDVVNRPDEKRIKRDNNYYTRKIMNRNR